MNNNKNNNPYGHLLDKYLDSAHFDYRTDDQKRKKRGRDTGTFWRKRRWTIQYGITCSGFIKAWIE